MRLSVYSRISHWPPYVCGPMRTILPILFNREIFFFIVSGDFDRIFANCSRVIPGFFLICSRTASIVVWGLVWVPLYDGLLKQTVTKPFPSVYVGSSTPASRQLSAILRMPDPPPNSPDRSSCIVLGRLLDCMGKNREAEASSPVITRVGAFLGSLSRLGHRKSPARWRCHDFRKHDAPDCL